MSWQGETARHEGWLQEVRRLGRSRQGGKGSRPLDIGVDSATGFRGEHEEWSQGNEIRSAAEYVLSFASFVLWPSFSFLCFSIRSAPSAQVYLAFYASFPHPPAPGLCRMQTEGASGVEVLLAFGPPLGLSPAQLWE